MKTLIVASIIGIALTACANVAPASISLPTPSPTTSSSTTPAPSLVPTPTTTLSPIQTSPAQIGYLEGHVNIGPLSPVQRVDAPTPVIPPEVYAARSLNIMQADGVTLVTNVKFNSDGTYRVALAPGIYVVTLARSGIDRASGLPQKITIESGKTVRLDIDIDTGIR